MDLLENSAGRHYSQVDTVLQSEHTFWRQYAYEFRIEQSTPINCDVWDPYVTFHWRIIRDISVHEFAV